MSITFRSLGRGDKFGYLLLTEPCEDYHDYMYRRGYHNYVHGRAGEFETYGDGLVQHSGDYPVALEHFGDFCASLGAFMLEADKKDRVRVMERLRFTFDVPYDLKGKVAFLLGLKYDESKERYYSLDTHRGECKVSASPSKQYDKRWHRIPSDAGKVEWAWSVLFPDDLSEPALRRYAMRNAFCTCVREAGGWVDKYAREFIGLSGEDNSETNQAYHLLRLTVEAASSIEHAESTLSCYKNNMGLTV